MGTQSKIGENEGVDAGDQIEDVSYVPEENHPGSPEERSDAQLLAEGDIEMPDVSDEIFVSPDSIYAPKADKEEAEEKAEGKEKPSEEKKEPPKDEKDEKKEGEEKPKPGKKPEKFEYPEEVVKLAKKYSQKRINQITREKYEEKRARENAEKELAEAKKKLDEARTAGKKAELTATKPIIDDFETEAEFHEALGRWSAKMELHEQEASRQEKSEQPEKQVETEQDRINRIKTLGEETYPDFMDVVSAIPLTKETFEAASDSDHAIEILYHLGENPELAQKISGLKAPLAIAREIGRIEAQFLEEEIPEVTESLPGQDNEFAEKSKPKQDKARPSPPTPVKPLGGGGKAVRSLEHASLDEYYEKRGFTRDGMKKRRVSS